MQLKKLHYLSGLTISLFIGLHLFNHFISIFGIEQHISLMDNLRLVYRNLLVESILLLAVATQIFSGIKLFLSKRKQAGIFFEKLQLWTGLYLAFFLIIHVSAIMAGRFVLHLDTNIYFGVAGLNTFPFNLFFVPYYSLAILSFFGHIAAIHAQKMKTTILGISIHQQSRIILLLGTTLTLIILYGLTNGFTGIEIPAAYKVMIGG